MSIQEKVEPKISFEDLFFPKDVQETISEVLEDHDFQSVLLDNGIPVRKKILVHGPSGCGKTSLAHAFAKKLGIPLFVTKGSKIVDSHLGSSERNISQVFKFMAVNKSVMLLDEFDSIASKRIESDSSASKACNGMVNELLLCLEESPLGMIVACTNMFDDLDDALLRRFDVVLELPYPKREVLLQIAERVLNGRFGISPEEVVDEAGSPAMIVQVAMNKMRRVVIDMEKEKQGIHQKKVDETLKRIRKKRQKAEQIEMKEVAST